jgi:hypothetical protein
MVFSIVLLSNSFAALVNAASRYSLDMEREVTALPLLSRRHVLRDTIQFLHLSDRAVLLTTEDANEHK